MRTTRQRNIDNIRRKSDRGEPLTETETKELLDHAEELHRYLDHQRPNWRMELSVGVG
jgi:hypothetical protein